MKTQRATELDQAAANRLAVMRAYLDGNASLARVAAEAGVSLRTARRWLARYRSVGPAGLARRPRPEAGVRKIAPELVEWIEGLALTRPRLSVATIHRRVSAWACDRGEPPPSHSSVHAIMAGLDPAMLTLAHEGAAAFRDRFELVHRHRAERPNAT